MRSVKIHAIAGGTVALSLVAAPAFAAPYPVPDAKNELVAAIAATNAAPSYQYLDNNSAGPRPTTRRGSTSR